MRADCSHVLAGPGIPKINLPILRSRREPQAIGGKVHGTKQKSALDTKLATQLHLLGFPDSHSAIQMGRRQRSIGRITDRIHPHVTILPVVVG